MSRRRPAPRARPSTTSSTRARTSGPPPPRSRAIRDFSVRPGELTLIQVLKFVGVAENGGAAKAMVEQGRVHVNGEPESRKRRQMLVGDIIQVDFPDGAGFRLVLDQTHDEAKVPGTAAKADDPLAP